MPEKINGGPAFGQVVELRCVRVDMTGSTEWEPEAMIAGGLTVRDYFAAKAMDRFIDLVPTQIWNQGQGLEGNTDEALMAAKAAYRMADAMMQVRGAA